MLGLGTTGNVPSAFRLVCCTAVLLLVRESVWTHSSRMGLCGEMGCGPVSYSLDSMPPSWTGTHMYGYMHHIDDRSYMIQLSYTMTTEISDDRERKRITRDNI